MGPHFGWSGVSGVHQDRENSESQVDEDSNMALTISSVGGELSKGTMASVSTSVWENAAPTTLTLIPDNSVPPQVSLVPFKLVSQCRNSKGVSLSKSVHWPFKRTPKPSL